MSACGHGSDGQLGVASGDSRGRAAEPNTCPRPRPVAYIVFVAAGGGQVMPSRRGQVWGRGKYGQPAL